MQRKIRSKKDEIEELIYPINGYRGTLERKGIKPKDHHKDNIKMIKEIRKDFVEKQERLKVTESNFKFISRFMEDAKISKYRVSSPRYFNK